MNVATSTVLDSVTVVDNEKTYVRNGSAHIYANCLHATATNNKKNSLQAYTERTEPALP